MRTPSPAEETLLAATIAILAEGVAVALFYAAAFVWIAIYATEPMR